MNFDDPSLLLSGMLVGAVGMGFFLYGKKNADLKSLLTGVVLSVVPILAHSMLILWGVTGLCATAHYLSNRL